MIGEATLRLARFLTEREYRSGQAIADELGCTRSAVWKQVGALRDLGIAVEAEPGRGYRLAQPLELLNHDLIQAACRKAGGKRLHSLLIHSDCDSTNAELLRLPGDQRHATAILAENQSAGRGRRGRDWHSPFGRNIYLSLGWRLGRGLGSLSCLPLVVAIAASRAIHAQGLVGQMVKWPNDLVLDGCKLGGCLVELRGDVHGPCLAVMGVGINLFMAGDPDTGVIDQAWTDVASHQPGVSRNELAGRLLREMGAAVVSFEKEGFDPFRADWQRLDALAGNEAVLYRDGAQLCGTARGVGRQGGLLLEQAGEVREFLAGEVTSSRPIAGGGSL